MSKHGAISTPLGLRLPERKPFAFIELVARVRALTFSTATKVFSGTAGDSGSWDTRTFGLGKWRGDDIKIEIRPGASTTLNVDSAGVARNVVPGWTSKDDLRLRLQSEQGFRYLGDLGEVDTAGLDLPFSCWPNGGGCALEWVVARITYRMKSNYNTLGSDIGSTLNVYYGTAHVFGAAGKDQGSPYDPVDVWITKEFRIWNTSSMVPGSAFNMRGWGPTIFGCNPSCGGKPDVASLEIVGSGSNKRTFANPSIAARNITPPGFQTPPQTTESDDPVEVVSGNYYHSKTDLAIPGPGIPLSWTRSYSAMGTNSGPGILGPMGPKWSHNWQASLREMTTGDVAINLPMGSTLLFRYSGGTYTPEAGLEATLVKNGGGDWTLTTKSQLVYSFDADGLWTEIEDRNGNSATLSYNGSDQLIGITDAVSRSLTISYNGDDLIESVEDPAGRTVYYDYDTDGLHIEVTDVLGETVTFDYQGYLLTEATDAKGNLFVRNTYDSFGRVIEQLDADNGLTEFQYATPGDGANRIIDQRGKQTTYYFDQQMRVTDIEDHAGAVTSFVYDADGNRTSVTNALNKTWTYTYDSDGNVLTATDPLSKTWTYTYNGFNDVLTVTDPLSRVTEFTYDGSGNLATIEDANGKVTTLTINGLGLVTEIEDPLTNAVTFDYDAYGNRTEVTNALAKAWLYTYDSAGRVTTVEDPLAHTTTLTYNAANLVLSAEDELGNTTSYTYDKNGNVLTVTDANLNVTTYVYDNRDQLVSITDAESQVWTFDYDELGNLVEKTNPRGKSSTYTYDDLNRLLTETDPLSKVRSYEYDLAGRLIGRTDPKSQEIVYTYNDRNELTNIAYPDLSFVSFQYNDAGARTQMVDSTGTTTYSYDNLYRLTGVTYPGSRTVSYGYDDAGRRTSITYPGGSDQVLYGYDAASRLTTVTDWDSNVTSYSYDDAGRMTLVELPNGVETSYAYDDGDRLTDIEHMLGMSTLAFVNYTLDNVGNRTQRVDGQGTHVYVYDDVYRLTSVTYPGPSTTSYVYDAFGNRTSMTVGANTTTYAYDDNDRITSVTPPSASPIAYTWDDNGNLEDRGNDEFVWDYEARLVETTVNSVTTEFAYRGDGLRDSRTVGMNTTTFTWDIAAGIPVVLDDGNRYIYGAHGLIAQVEGTDWYYFLTDGLGSTMAITDDVGTVVRDYAYDVFGEVTGGSGGGGFGVPVRRGAGGRLDGPAVPAQPLLRHGVRDVHIEGPDGCRHRVAGQSICLRRPT